jgi:hypothetical protein
MSDRDAFLAEPDEVASDVLERKLDAILQTERTGSPVRTAYGTFEEKVGISSSLAQMPALESYDMPLTATFGTDDETSIDRIVELQQRLDKKKEKEEYASSASADYIAEATKREMDKQTAAFGVHEDDDAPEEELEDNDAEATPGQYGNILNYLTKKGRKKEKEKKLRIRMETEKAKQTIKQEMRQERLDKLQGKDVYKALPPLERLDPPNSSFAASDRRDKQRKQPAPRPSRALTPVERVLFSHMSDAVRLGPGASLQAVEKKFASMASARSADLNYFGSLALGGALGKIRASVEAAAPLKGVALQQAANAFHAQAKTPMDAAKATLFANALDDYGNHVRKLATDCAPDQKSQEQAALASGEQLADALLEETKDASQSWDASHPAVALTAVTDRVFQAVMRSAVPNNDAYVANQVKSFWSSDIGLATWKATAQKHFV